MIKQRERRQHKAGEECVHHAEYGRKKEKPDVVAEFSACSGCPDRDVVCIDREANSESRANEKRNAENLTTCAQRYQARRGCQRQRYAVEQYEKCHRIVGMTKLESSVMPSGQRAVTVFTLV